MKEKTISSSHRTLVFENERALQLSLLQVDFGLDNLFPITLMRREVPVGSCIPDLVCVRFLEMPTPELWPHQWAYRHAHVLWLLRRWKYLRLETIAARCYESPEKIFIILKQLLKSGAVIALDTGAFSLSDEMKNLRAEVISVEAKLHHWRDALEQAKRYKQFSDRAFVVMDPNGIPTKIEAIRAFRASRIGLCTVVGKAVKWVVPLYTTDMRLSPDREYLISAAASSTRQTLWSFR
jgi:hypothetical protein